MLQRPSTSAPVRRAALAIALTGAGLAAAPAAASAAGNTINCDASAIRGQLLTLPAIEPATANRGGDRCRTTRTPASLSLSSLGLPLVTGVLGAATYASGEDDKQAALAMGGVTNLSIGSLAQLGLTLPDLMQYVPSSVQNVHLDLAGGLGPLLTTVNTVLALVNPSLQLPSSLDVNLADAIRGLLPAIPSTALLNVDAAMAYAAAGCRDGRAVPAGTSRVAGVSVLGQGIGADGVLGAVLPIIDGQQLDLGKLDVTKIQLPKVLTDALPLLSGTLATSLLQQVQGLLQSALAALPKIPIPAQLLQVDVRPDVQTVEDGVLTQQALRVRIGVLGQSAVDAVLGEARVSVKGVDCTPPATARDAGASASQLALQCTKRRLVLLDVVRHGSRVRLYGAADQRYVGRTVAVRFEGTRRVVAHAKVRRDGTFVASAKLPSRRLRATNRARYRAELGSQRSLNLKLRRRMHVTSMTSRDGKVTIKGRVVRPLGKPIQKIRVQRRVSCRRNATVKTITPRRDGTFSVTVRAPSGKDAAVYRLATKVRKSTRNRKMYPTFTLPRGVNIRR